MPHRRLHAPTIERCVCCHIPQNFTFTSQSQLAVCPKCAPHSQEVASRRGKDDQVHKEMWHAFFNEVDNRHRTHIQTLVEKVAEQAARIEELEGRFREAAGNLTPDQLEEFAEAELVQEARRQRDGARHAYDSAMDSLDAIDNHHEEMSNGRCKCGHLFERCATGQYLEGSTGQRIDKWRNFQRGGF